VLLYSFVVLFHLYLTIAAFALNLLFLRVFLDDKISAGKSAIRHCACAGHFNKSFIFASHNILHIYEIKLAVRNRGECLFSQQIFHVL